jgi:hypothetical protein
LKTCIICEKAFWPRSTLQTVCGVNCAIKIKKVAKKKEKEKDRETKERLKTISQLEEDCRKIVQHIARIRDKKYGCISCHMGPDYGGVWHGSHYRSHGGCSSLQMHLWNINKSCAQCNLFKSGNREGYVKGLIERYGKERVEWLDCQPKSKKFSREYLQRFKIVMRKRLKRLDLRRDGM